MACPHLAYRSLGSGEERAFCTIADRFVAPLRADVCHDRWTFDHETHCEIYRAWAGED